MAFDGGFTRKIAEELRAACDCHIDKLYQPSADELVFLLRKKGFVKRLLISVRSGAVRLHFTEDRPENPAEPPMFCMLARKHFSSAKLVEVRQKGFERIIELLFETSNEMGDRIHPKIICELIGNQSNIVLVADDGRIIDAVRRSDISTDKRIVQPGAKYEYPTPQDKLDITVNSADEIVNKVLLFKGVPLTRALLDTVSGLSPLVCREIAIKVCGDDKITDDITEIAALVSQIEFISNELKQGGVPFMLYKQDGTPADYCYTQIKQYGDTYKTQEFESYSGLLDAFYRERENKARIKKLSSDLVRLVSNLTLRAQKRIAARMQELKACENREKLRIYGELIKANMHLIKSGDTKAVVTNFYDENLAEIVIPLDAALSPTANAAKYFKEYKKSCVAQQTLGELVEKDKAEIKYFESVSESLLRCDTAADISEIREELTVGGYIKVKKGDKRKKNANPTLKEYISTEGYRIVVGKNNLQNDYITTRLASKNDLWFHTKGIHGSHVVILCAGEQVSDETLVFAARLAAKNSKAASSSNVPVDYTPIKYVKKPAGAKPGMVIYTTNKTLFVTPEEEK